VTSPTIPFVAAAPWLAVPLITLVRLRDSPSLDDVPPIPSPDAPLISVVIPARNEARNLPRCVESILRSRYPALEVIVVNDRSEDETGIIAHAFAARDPRVRAVDAPPLPEGWFGKQWACAQGAAAARGALLCFTDADTTHAPDLLPRAERVLRAQSLDLLSVAGHQELRTFWERVVQPQVFTMLAMRYGGAHHVNRSRRAADKIANGQFMLFARAAYDDVGGHAAVRAKAAEDLALAQWLFEQGKRTALVSGVAQLSTRMYASLGEIVRGWMKNIYAGALDTVPFGALGRALLPAALLSVPAAMLAPVVLLLLGLAGVVGGAVTTWALLCTVIMLIWWAAVYGIAIRTTPAYALTFPLGAVVVAYIIVRALARGRVVEWKGRVYRAG
jgi:chlorobactene glucosyltransferase